jgi:aerobic-type carbon monoxide dehydrogenase small subunit (CoxS/CutS family)
MALTLLVNGRERTVEAAPEETLLAVLRDRLELTGTKYGCGEGQCGACTILIDGSPARSCRMQANTAAGRKITTIEGLAQGEELHLMQQAFLDAEAFQCGYCTPGMILSAVALLERTGNPTDVEIIRHLNGNVCRCGTYSRILDAVHRAVAMSRSKQHASR